MINLDKKFDLENTSRIKKFFLILVGYIFIGLGILGIILPIMPSTIFFILAAASFLRSSEKNYERLINNRYIGKYIKNYIEQHGMTKSSKIVSISFLWVTLLVSIFIFAEFLWLKILLTLIGIGVTMHISKLNTLKEEDGNAEQSVKSEIGFSETES